MPELEENNDEGDNVMSVKLPAYGVGNPRLWFAQIEAIFHCRRITSEGTKYSHIVANLPTDVATEIADLIYERPAEQPYTKVKEALINRTAATDEQNIRTLLSGMQLGDRTPSQLLRHMKHLMGNRPITEPILKELWLQNLPNDMRTVLSVVHKDTLLETLAQLADQVHSSYGLRAPATMQPVTSESSIAQQLENLGQEFSAMKLELNALRHQMHQKEYARFRSRSRTPSLPRDASCSSPPSNRVRICRYHRRFGSQAKRCQPYCTFYSAMKFPGNDRAEQ